MAYDVFISHSSKDKALADAICAGLENRGIRCWIAPRDVQPGEEWTKAIVNAIDDCKIFLLVLSDNSNKSSQAIREVDCAEKHEKTIIPFRIEDIQPTGSMEYYLGSLHWLDAITRPMEQNIEKLADYIGHILHYPEKTIAQELEVEEKPKKTEVQKPSEPSNEVKKPQQNRKWIWFGAVAFCVLAAIVGFVLGKGRLTSSAIPQETMDVATSPSPTQSVMPATPTVTSTLMNSSTVPTVAPCSSTDNEPGEKEIGATRVSEKDCMTMVYIPARQFNMGDPNSDAHWVSLDAYWMDQTEVTNSMFSTFVNETGYFTYAELHSQNEYWEWPHTSIMEKGNYAVVEVTWNDAVAYCEWAGKRLPTDAEWQNALMGPNSYMFPWGNQSDDLSLANINKRSGGLDYGGEEPVGSYPNDVSGYGIMDMGGNVSEWVSDWYQEASYSSEVQENPQGPISGTEKCLRGASFFDDSNFPSFVRDQKSTPDTFQSNIGFRCVQSAE